MHLNSLKHWGFPFILVTIIIGLFMAGCVTRSAPVRLVTSTPDPPPVGPTISPATLAPPTALPTIVMQVGQTPTSRVTPLPLATTLPIGYAQVRSNSEWSPIIQVFDGVEMVLVPVGCFTLGSNTGDSDEAPAHQMCVERPFWIDRTEVTNEAYGSTGYVTRPNHHRDSVNLTEAQVFCASRGARIPTEAEWEYAARGPDSWVYPWGNAFIPDNVVYENNSNATSAEVGSHPGGASWVGALDMSGNLWEWTTTIYEGYEYPYDATDGREDPENLYASRVIRGGSWSNPAGFQRASARKDKHPTLEWYVYVGFRCVRDVE